MARSDVLVVPSIVETFGVVVVEAVAARLPVVATTALPDHELVAGRFGLVVPPADRAALRDAVERMLDDGWVIPATVAASFVRSYSSQVVAERWQSVYGSVARVS
jgi:glycosyltransferase involved in cell wall biosynthesis